MGMALSGMGSTMRHTIGWAWAWIAIAFFGCGGSPFDVAAQAPVVDAGSEASVIVSEVATPAMPEASVPDVLDAATTTITNEASAPPASDCPVGYVCALVDAGSDAVAPGDLPDPNCPAGVHTTVSGVVYDSTLTVPESGVTVFAPKAATLPIFVCGSTEYPALFGSAVTDAAGHFVLDNVPPGTDVPIVVQSAQWRQVFRLAIVRKCVDNPQPDRTLYLSYDMTKGATCYQAGDN